MTLEPLAHVVVLPWLVVGLGRFLLHSLEGRRLGRLVKNHHPTLWEAEHPMPWVLIIDQQYMGFLMQRRYEALEDEALVTSFEELRSQLVRTAVFTGAGFAVAAVFALLLS